MSLTHRRRSALAALALTVAGVAHADPLRVGVRPDLTPGLIQGAWQSLTVQVSNPRDAAPIDGFVQVRLVDNRMGAAPASVPVSAPIRVAPGATGEARVRVYVPEEFVASVQVGVHRADKTPLGASTIDGLPMARLGMRLLSVAPDPDERTWMAGLRNRSLGVYHLGHGELVAASKPNTLAYNAAQPLSVSEIGARDLPERASDYDAFAVVHLGAGTGAIDGARRDALNAFVRRGGIVLDASGAGLSDAGWGIVVSDPARWRTPERLAELLRSRIGMGSYSASRDSTAAWPDEGMRYDAFARQVLQGQGLQAPPVGVLMGFLAFYLLLVAPGQYLILKRLDRREWAWFVTPALALGFTAAAYGAAHRLRSDHSFHNTAAIAEMGAGSGQATVSGAVGIYAPRTGTYAVGIDAPESLAWAGQANAMRQADEGARIEEINIGQWAMRAVSFRSDGVRIGDGVAVATRRLPGGRLRATVENRTGYRIVGAQFSAGKFHYSMGTLDPGARWSVEMSIPVGEDLGAPSEAWSSIDDFRMPADPIRQDLQTKAESRLQMRAKAGVRAPGIVLTGRIAANVVPLRIEGAPSQAREQSTWIVVHAPLDR